MKSVLLFFPLLAAALFAADDPSAVLRERNETAAQRDARMAWWRDAKFGMFIHWGVYAVPAGFYNGKSSGKYSEWIMCDQKIPMAEYQKYAGDFDAKDFDPEAWVIAAKNAGMRYMVITSKHHDGFALFETKASPWNIVKASPFGKDALKLLAAACRKHGMKLGFYYSHAQDWNNGGTCLPKKWDPAMERNFDEYIDEVAIPQVKELLTNYGEFPDILWWDTPYKIYPTQCKRIFDAVMPLRKNLIVNNRLGGGFVGDTETPEGNIPAQGYPGRDWETCMTMTGSWGYASDKEKAQSPTLFIRQLCDIASKGGNYLLNVGPDAHGRIPQPCLEALAQVGEWMKKNGQAIYGTIASPFPRRAAWGVISRRPDNAGTGVTLYFLVNDWPKDGGSIVARAVSIPPDSAKVLTTGAGVPFKMENGSLVLTPGVPAPDPAVSVIALHFPSLPPAVPLPTPGPDGVLTLTARDADFPTVDARSIKLVPDSKGDFLGAWTDGTQRPFFQFSTPSGPKTRTYDVSAEVSGAPGSIRVQVGRSTIDTKLPGTSGPADWQTVALGSLIFAPGITELTIVPNRGDWQGIQLRRIILSPNASSRNAM